MKRDKEESDKQSPTEGSKCPGGADDNNWLGLILMGRFQRCTRRNVATCYGGRVRCAFADTRIVFDEERDVSTARHNDPNSFVDAFDGEILVESLPQQAGVVANNIVFTGVVSAGSSKDLFANLLLGN